MNIGETKEIGERRPEIIPRKTPAPTPQPQRQKEKEKA